MVFSSCGGNLGYILELRGDDPSKLMSVQRYHDSCRVTSDNSGFSLRLRQVNRDASGGEARDPGSLSSCQRDIGIPINFQEESGIVTF